MYEDSWYSYVPEQHSKSEAAFSLPSKHHRRESLLKQPNGNDPMLETSGPIMELLEDTSGLKDPPKATLVKRAKSYSNFYEDATSYLSNTVDKNQGLDISDFSRKNETFAPFGSNFEDFEEDLLNASQEEYQLYRDQLALSERHLSNLLDDTSSALAILATLSEAFKTVEVQTAAFQAQCEDLLAEQKRLRDLADEIGTDLQYYGYLEPLTRRLNAPGTSRLVRNDDFLDMLRNLNTCIDFMDQHPHYRDSTVYKTRYISLLERSLNIVQVAFSSALREITDDVTKQLKSKEQNETTEYILLYGKYEAVAERLGVPLETLLHTSEFAFGRRGDASNRNPYIEQWHELFKQLVDAFLKCREPVGPVVMKNLRKLITNEPRSDTEFELFARRAVQYVFDVCHNELQLANKYFINGPIVAVYPVLESWKVQGNYTEKLEQNRLSHVKTLHTFLAPYLSNGDLRRVVDLVNWVETMCVTVVEDDDVHELPQEGYRSAAQILLNDHLWPLSDSLFIKAAAELEHFKPTPDELNIYVSGEVPLTHNNAASNEHDTKIQIGNTAHTDPAVSSAYPTVKTAVSLLIMYNDSKYDRPKKGDVLYEIVHQATESLQRAATTIKRTSTIMDAQVFLIKNLMLIENLFMTHEIPDSVRQSSELDFSPIWETIRELQARQQLFNPLAYITPLVRGQLLPTVVDQILDARKELEKVLVQQITAFTKYWKQRLVEKNPKTKESVEMATAELEKLLNKVFEDETTKAALWKMIRADQSGA